MGVIKINVIFKIFSASNSNRIVFHNDAQLKHATSSRSQLYISLLYIIQAAFHLHPYMVIVGFIVVCFLISL